MLNTNTTNNQKKLCLHKHIENRQDRDVVDRMASTHRASIPIAKATATVAPAAAAAAIGEVAKAIGVRRLSTQADVKDVNAISRAVLKAKAAIMEIMEADAPRAVRAADVNAMNKAVSKAKGTVDPMDPTMVSVPADASGRSRAVLKAKAAIIMEIMEANAPRAAKAADVNAMNKAVLKAKVAAATKASMKRVLQEMAGSENAMSRAVLKAKTGAVQVDIRNHAKRIPKMNHAEEAGRAVAKALAITATKARLVAVFTATGMRMNGAAMRKMIPAVIPAAAARRNIQIRNGERSAGGDGRMNPSSPFAQ